MRTLLWAAVLLAGCGGGPPSLGKLAKGERRPDGVSVDPPTARPPLLRRGGADAGLLLLRAPLGAERALGTLRELFRAMIVGSTDGLDDLFTADAQFQQPRGMPYYGPHYGGGGGAVRWVKQRMQRLDYTKLAGEALWEDGEVQIFRHGDPPPADAASAVRTADLGPEDLILRFQVHTTRIGSTRYFGEDWVVWLRPDEQRKGRYRISLVVEDFTMQ